PHPVVLILRGVAGPDDGYTEIARRLAEWGYVALVHGWKVRGADPTDEPCTPICRERCPSWDRSDRLISRDWPSSASVAVGGTRSWRPERTRRSAWSSSSTALPSGRRGLSQVPSPTTSPRAWTSPCWSCTARRTSGGP